MSYAEQIRAIKTEWPDPDTPHFRQISVDSLWKQCHEIAQKADAEINELKNQHTGG